MVALNHLLKNQVSYIVFFRYDKINSIKTTTNGKRKREIGVVTTTTIMQIIPMAKQIQKYLVRNFQRMPFFGVEAFIRRGNLQDGGAYKLLLIFKEQWNEEGCLLNDLLKILSFNKSKQIACF